MNKDFRANKVIKTSLVEVKVWKTQGVISRTIGEIINEVHSLPKQLYNYESFPIVGLDDIIENETVIYFTKKNRRKFRITPIIVKVEEIIVED